MIDTIYTYRNKFDEHFHFLLFELAGFYSLDLSELQSFKFINSNFSVKPLARRKCVHNDKYIWVIKTRQIYYTTDHMLSLNDNGIINKNSDHEKRH